MNNGQRGLSAILRPLGTGVTVTAAPSVADLLADPRPAARSAALHEQGLADRAGLAWVLDRVEAWCTSTPPAPRRSSRLPRRGRAPAVRRRRGARGVPAGPDPRRTGGAGAALDLVAGSPELWSRRRRGLRALRTDLGRMRVLDELGRHREAAAVGEAS